jgi:hypothetical protein
MLAEAMIVASTKVPVRTMTSCTSSCRTISWNREQSRPFSTSALRKRRKAVRSGVASFAAKPQGLDRLPTGAQGSVMAALEELAGLDFVRLLLTARPDTRLPKAASVFSLPQAPEEHVRQYLQRRAIPEQRWIEVVGAARGNWLVVRLLADVLAERPDAEIREAGQLALYDAYEELLLRCGATGDDATQHLLALLAAAGAGPLLPLSLLCAASQALGGPAATPAAVRDHLVQLRGLAVRSGAGTEQEHAGLFHDTLADYIAARAPEQNRPAHRALVASIEALAPVGSGPADLSDPVQRPIIRTRSGPGNRLTV